MAQRLTIDETAFTAKCLDLLVKIGDDAVKKDHYGEAVTDIIRFFGADRPRMIDTLNKVRIVKDKVKSHLQDAYG